MRPDDNIKITIHLQRRPDGGLRAWSDDMPGLVLSHRDPERVLEDIIPAVETIVSEMTGKAMKASPLVSLPTAVRSIRDEPRRPLSLTRFITSLSSRAGFQDEVREYVAWPAMA
jgi:hypothetical protein